MWSYLESLSRATRKIGVYRGDHKERATGPFRHKSNEEYIKRPRGLFRAQALLWALQAYLGPTGPTGCDNPCSSTGYGPSRAHNQSQNRLMGHTGPYRPYIGHQAPSPENEVSPVLEDG